MSAPVFVMGTQRSGTTLLTRVLSAHPEIFIQNELDLPQIFKPGFGPEQIVEAIKFQILDETGISLEQKLAEKGSEAMWGLKDPQLTEYIPQLREFLPESKFIIIVRDGRGVTNSYMENKWGLGTNALYGAKRWQREVQQQMEFMQEAPDNFIYIRYEDLVDDLEANMRKVCEFLGKDFHSDILNYNKQRSDYKQQRENANTFKAPDKKLAEKWRQRLSGFEIDVVESEAGETLKQHGYELVGKPLSLSKWQLLYFKWHQKIIGEFQIQYRWRKSRVLQFMEKRKRAKAALQ